MFIAILTAVAILSVCSLYVWEVARSRTRHQADPVRSGREPEFARLGEQDWYEQALTSMEWTR